MSSRKIFKIKRPNKNDDDDDDKQLIINESDNILNKTVGFKINNNDNKEKDNNLFQRYQPLFIHGTENPTNSLFNPVNQNLFN